MVTDEIVQIAARNFDLRLGTIGALRKSLEAVDAYLCEREGAKAGVTDFAVDRAWSCNREAEGGPRCTAWCGHPNYCMVAYRDAPKRGEE